MWNEIYNCANVKILEGSLELGELEFPSIK
jgi:hypothetical protein